MADRLADVHSTLPTDRFTDIAHCRLLKCASRTNTLVDRVSSLLPQTQSTAAYVQQCTPTTPIVRLRRMEMKPTQLSDLDLEQLAVCGSTSRITLILEH
jgi:hypothetical protein